MHRPKSLFGRASTKSGFGLGGPDAEPEDESLAGTDDTLEEEDLEHTGMGSLAGISIRRKSDGGGGPALPSASPASVAPSRQGEPRNIAEYWSQLRKGRRWPARTDIDSKLVGIKWRNSLIMVVGENGMPWRFETLMSDVLRGGGISLTSNEIDFNHLVMEWMLSIGRRAQEAGRPVEDTDVFPTKDGDTRYRAIAVPLGENDSQVTHILCHIVRI